MDNQKWYQKNVTIVIALLTMGPFALPLVWAHPRYRPSVKIAVTILVVIFTLALTAATALALKFIASYYGLVFGTGAAA